MDVNIQATQQLSTIYPDIEDQLCNKHTVHLNRCASVFHQLYQANVQSMIILKGMANIAATAECALTMHIENGVCVCVSTVHQSQPGHQKLYINSNRSFVRGQSLKDNEQLQQQHILNHKGQIINYDQSNKAVAKHADSLTEQQRIVHQVYRMGTEDLSLAKVKSGIIYIHSNLHPAAFRESYNMIVGLYLAILQLNGLLSTMSVKQIIRKISNCTLLSKWQLDSVSNSFMGINRNFLFSYMAKDTMLMTLDPQYKLIFVKTSAIACLSSTGLMSGYKNVQPANDINKYKQTLKDIVKQQFQCESLIIALENNPQDVKQRILQSIQHQQPQLSAFAINQIQKSVSIIQFARQQINFVQFMHKIEAIHSSEHSVEGKDMVKNAKQRIVSQMGAHIKGIFSAENGQFTVLIATRNNFTDLINRLTKMMAQNIKSSKSVEGEEVGMQKKWAKQQKISSMVFSCVPSRGVCVLDPRGSMWYDYQ